MLSEQNVQSDLLDEKHCGSSYASKLTPKRLHITNVFLCFTIAETFAISIVVENEKVRLSIDFIICNISIKFKFEGIIDIIEFESATLSQMIFKNCSKRILAFCLSNTKLKFLLEL